MVKSSTIAYKYLKSKHQNVRKLGNGDFVCDGNKYYSPRLVRGNTIWISSRRFEQLLKKNAIILAVNKDKVVEIPTANIKKKESEIAEIEGIKVKIVDDYVRIRIPRELKKKLDAISKNPSDAISKLLGLHEKVSITPAAGLTNEALAFRMCLYIAKYGLHDYIRVMSKVLAKRECKLDEFNEEELKIIKELVASRVMHIDHRIDGDYVKPLCSFKLVEDPDCVKFTMFYFRDFCRMYCYRYDSCSLVKNSKSNIFGFTITYSHEEFKSKTPEELMAKWIGECLK